MKVLFVSSGNKKNGISVVVKNQGESLQRQGIYVDYYPIEGTGFSGYRRNIRKLSRVIKTGGYDVIHAHYSLSGFVATFASLFKSKIVVSLMGTFRKGSFKYYLVRFFAITRWKAVIVKSKRMKLQIGIHSAQIIPNGVQMELFKDELPREELRQELAFKKDKKYVLFASSPKRPEKNFKLCSEALELLNDNSVEVCILSEMPHEKVIQYMLAGDVLMLTSLTEGSPNVIKEAMTANCPIVATDVGDVRHIIDDTSGCFILDSFSSEEATEKLKAALNFNQRTNGRERILSLGLDDRSVAHQIISVYNS